ncbi:MAG: hypothetical protein QW791_09485 [Candidatus Bathyarchaeia archaeon]
MALNEACNKSCVPEGLARTKEELTKKLHETIQLENVAVTPLFSEIWRRVHPAIDVVDGVAYIGVDLSCEVQDADGKVQIRDFHFLITSDQRRFLCHKEALIKEKMQLAHSVVKLPNRWSSESVNAWLNGKVQVDPKELYIAVKTAFETYIEFEGEVNYDFLTLWTIGTYFFHLFQSYPYLYIGGTKQVGKTKLLTLLYLLCHNAIFSNNISTASAFRLIQSGRCTLLMDETEKLSNPEREIDFRNMLFAGYKKGAFVYRTDKDTLQPEPFEVYSPKALANIKGIEDVLEDRCITIIMKRGKNLDIVNAEIPIKSEVWRQIRDMLYVFYLSYWHEFSELNGLCELNRETLLKQRELELWKPILMLARFFDRYFKGLYERILKFAEQKSREKLTENLTETLDFILVQTLNAIVKEDGFYKVKTIKEAVAANFDEDQKWLTTKWIGNALRRLGFAEKRRFGTGYEYYLSREKVADLAERLGISKTHSPPSSQSPLSSQPSLTKENVEAVLNALTEALKVRGTATTQEVALEANLSVELVRAVLKVLEREGRVYQPFPDWWKIA